MNIYNSEGLKSHETDDFVYHLETDHKNKMYKLRNLYDNALKGDKSSLSDLLDEVYECGFKSAKELSI